MSSCTVMSMPSFLNCAGRRTDPRFLYPSGAVITYTPDSVGRMLSAVDTTNSSQPMNYVTGATYNAPGLLTASTYGQTTSFTGILNTFSFNSRLQPVNLWSSSPVRNTDEPDSGTGELKGISGKMNI